MKKVAINGFGRIGRIALKLMSEMDDIEVVAINSRSDAMQLAYLYKYDSIHGAINNKIKYDENNIIINDKKIPVFMESDPENLCWKKLDVDVVLECTGVFTTLELARKHIIAGAKHVIISAGSSDDIKTIVYDVNDDILDGTEEVISAASCTTNCLAPIVNLINKKYGIVNGYMSTIHAITADQVVLDSTHKKGILSRRGRDCNLNIIPTTTGAAKAIGKVIPELNHKIDGISFRVPVHDGSLLDLTLNLEKGTTTEEVNSLFKTNQSDTIKFTKAPIVSSDIIGDKSGCIIDGLSTKVIDGKLLKIIAWYDNEVGYTAQMLRIIDVLL